MGGLQVSWPFATLTLADDRLQMSSWFTSTVEFRPTQVSIRITGGTRLVFDHVVQGLDSYISFSPVGGTRYISQLVEGLRKRGFVVT